MRMRCNNPRNQEYRRYGGKGIRVCERWSSFANFLADMGERLSGTSLDRIDSSQDYTPDNCRWATAREQTLNTSRIRWIEFGGRKQCLSDWARELGMFPESIHHSAKKRGTTPEEEMLRRLRTR